MDENILNEYINELNTLESISEVVDLSSDNNTNSNNTNTEFENTAIQLNNDNLITDMTTSRFSGTSWYEDMQGLEATVIGLGGIGSFAAFIAARLGIFRMDLFDPDIIEESNLSGQLFSISDIGSYKSDIVRNLIKSYNTNCYCCSINRRFDTSYTMKRICICCVDNMQSRKESFESWLSTVKSKALINEDFTKSFLFIDGRLTIDKLQLFCIRGDDTYNINRYKQEFLFTDAEAETEICSMKQTTYMASMIGSLISNILVNYVIGLKEDIGIKCLPFYVEYNSLTMCLHTEL